MALKSAPPKNSRVLLKFHSLPRDSQNGIENIDVDLENILLQELSTPKTFPSQNHIPFIRRSAKILSPLPIIPNENPQSFNRPGVPGKQHNRKSIRWAKIVDGASRADRAISARARGTSGQWTIPSLLQRLHYSNYAGGTSWPSGLEGKSRDL